MNVPAMIGIDRVKVGRRELIATRSWPRRSGRLLLEYRDGEGEIWAGQWHPEGTELSRIEDIARQTVRVSDPDSVALRSRGRLIVHGGGADRKLVSLYQIARQPGSRLVSHRCERRGVVDVVGSGFAKVLPVERSAAAARAGIAASKLKVIRAPRMVSAPRGGVTTWEALPGATLNQLGDDVPETAWGDLGRQLRALHGSPIPPGLPHHGADEEAAVVSGWVDRLAAFDPDRAGRCADDLRRVRNSLAEGVRCRRLIHRDLHDKQILLDERNGLGWIDFDTLSSGEAAIDIANLLVHLDLRVNQGRLSPPRAASAAGAFVAGYRPDLPTRRRTSVYLAAIRLRLYCLYAFRPNALEAEWLSRRGPAASSIDV